MNGSPHQLRPSIQVDTRRANVQLQHAHIAPPIAQSTRPATGGQLAVVRLPSNRARVRALQSRATQTSLGFTAEPIPPTRHPCSPYHWTSVQHGLHLVPLRSPTRAPVGPRSLRFYQFVDRFALEPTAISTERGLKHFTFNVAVGDLVRRSRFATKAPFLLHQFQNGSVRFRMRLIKDHQEHAAPAALSDWAPCPTHWPASMFIAVNDRHLTPRRKQHFHLDLPVELTDIIVQGENKVKLSLPKAGEDSKHGIIYYVAVEVVVVWDHATVTAGIKKHGQIPAEITKREVQRRLQPDNSDKIAVESKGLVVPVTDPFSCMIISTPVRGVSCKHIECFDLGTWLLTRPRKPARGEGEPSMVDGWNCPLCDCDASPLNLRVDGYFTEFLETLRLATEQSGVKRIAFNPDGTWVRVDDEAIARAETEGILRQAGVDSGPLPQSGVSNAHANAYNEVIEIVDD